MKTLEYYIEAYEENGKTIIIVERWTIDAYKYNKPKKQWFFKKQEEIRIKDEADNTVIKDNMLEFKEYKSKQAVKKRFNKEKDMMQRKICG